MYGIMESRRWERYFLISLGIHCLVIIVIAGFGLRASPARVNNTGEFSIQLVNSSEASMQGNSSLAEAAASFSNPVASKQIFPQKETSVYEPEKLERSINTNDGLEAVQVSEANTNNSQITGNADNSSESGRQITGRGMATAEQSSSQEAGNGMFSNGNFLSNGDGSYTALDAEGISYTIIRDADAKYPEEARSIGYSRVVSVQAKILVGLDGFVENVEIVNSVPNLGFKESAIQALRKMQFAPIYYKNHNVKMYFIKKIYFQP
jgi:TonB family protein